MKLLEELLVTIFQMSLRNLLLSLFSPLIKILQAVSYTHLVEIQLVGNIPIVSEAKISWLSTSLTIGMLPTS